ncbi:hypothetical protein [Variovorax sp. YR566]|jgi:hypothetical protein|uniref:hypothetical protein n=1 Tax=Variovorax sp. YR566 TaxID=3450237 RepID=UPI003F7DE7BF
MAIQTPTNAIALIPAAHQPMPVGLLSMPVEMIQLILFNLGPALIPAPGALRCSSHGARNMTTDALGIDPHPMRRATITSNLIMLRDRARAMKDQITAKAVALGLKLQAANDKRSLKRL